MTAPTPQHVASYLNRAGDYEVIVTQLANGDYTVTVYDVNAVETLPLAIHFDTMGRAMDYALTCAASGDDQEVPV